MTSRAANVWRWIGTAAVFTLLGPLTISLCTLAVLFGIDAVLDAGLFRRQDTFVSILMGPVAIATPGAVIVGVIMASWSTKLASRNAWLGRAALVFALFAMITVGILLALVLSFNETSLALLAFLWRIAAVAGAMAALGAVTGVVCGLATLRLRPRRSSVGAAEVFG